jgi:hypothetical protein
MPRPACPETGSRADPADERQRSADTQFLARSAALPGRLAGLSLGGEAADKPSQTSN